jgi:hypothetical protein
MNFKTVDGKKILRTSIPFMGKKIERKYLGLNGLYLSKKTDFKSITVESVRNVMDQLNNWPRKTLDY